MKSIPFTFSIFFAVNILLMYSTRAYSQDESQLVYPGDDGKLVYVEHSNTAESNEENLIIDYSNCGYGGGGVAIPDVPVKVTLYPMFGDDRTRIQNAINYVSGLDPDENGFRGAVLLKAGTYEVNEGLSGGGDALRISTSGVVLRGEGQGSNGTVITTSLEAKHSIIATRPNNRSISTSNKTQISDPYVGSGTFNFQVEDAGGYAIGDTIIVRFTPNQTWLDETYANAYMGDGDSDWTTSEYTISYERFITDINGDRFSIHSPIILPMQSKFGGGEVEKVKVNRKRIRDVGIENLRLVGVGITPTCQANDKERLEIAVFLAYLEHSWMRGVTVVHANKAHFVSWDSHYMTIEDCAGIIPLGPKNAPNRYTFYFDAASSHNLCQRTFTDDGRHDYVTGPRIPGPNVFLDGRSLRGGTQGPHQRFATGTLFDNLKLASLIALEHRGGSGSGHSWAGMQSMLWNTESPSIICDAPAGHMNYAIGNTGTEVLSGYINNTRTGVYRGLYDHHGSHVATRSLYLKQLEDRMGPDAVKDITIPEQLDGNIYDMLEEWQGKGKLSEYNIEILKAPAALAVTDLEYSETSKFVKLQWTENVPDETAFILERSSDGGETFELLAELPANTVQFTDYDLQQSTYHYRVKAKNASMESTYCNLYVDLEDENLYGEIYFQLNLRDISDRYAEGAVWVVTDDGAERYEMSDEDGDGIFSIVLSLMLETNFHYTFAYQNGADSATNIVVEDFSGDCTDSNGKRYVLVSPGGKELTPYLFGTCDVAPPPGEDITDLAGTIIFGSNDDEVWIDGDNGSGSPSGEGIEMLIDNNVDTKYLVRARLSWIEVKTNKYVNLKGYTITSANDDPSRDPSDWRLKAWDSENDRWETLHTVDDNPSWENRFMKRVWTFDSEIWSHRYRLIVSDINGNAQTLMQMAELELFGEVGEPTILKEEKLMDLKVYPNPTKDFLNIDLNEPVDESLEIEVYDLSGKKIIARELSVAGNSSFRISTTALESGIYILRLVCEEQSYIRKIIIE